MIGKIISHYRITAELGAGGMGVVYRAQDSKLQRDVAIKMLHAERATDTGLMLRLRKEARTLAELSHPNIGGIFGFEDDAAGVALILEYVEGQTLADLIQDGPLELEACLDIAGQIAAALDYAHARGILHRDLKPANIKVGSDRRVRVLDFGLATHKRPLIVDAAALTEDVGLTQPGMLLGSPAYMSPEQIKGESVDERTDNWGWGCILFEMLTGQMAFRANSIPETHVAVLTTEPDWELLPANCPDSLARLIRRCLTKASGRRLRSAGDALLDIQEMQGDVPEGRALSFQPSKRPLSRSIWGLSVAALFVVAAVIITRMGYFPVVPERSHLRFDVLMPYGVNLNQAMGGSLSLAPTADRLAYVGNENGRRHVFLHRFDQAGQTAVSRTEDADCVAFSPDGQWLAFATPSRLNKIHLATQRVVPLCQLDYVGSIWWAGNDTIYVVASTRFTGQLSEVQTANGDGIYAVHADGGESVRLTAAVALDRPTYQTSLTVATDGRHMLFAEKSIWAFSVERVVVRDNRTGARKVLIEDGGQPLLIGDGRLLFMRNDELLHAFVDLERGKLLSDPVTVQSGILGTGINPVSVAADGSLAFITSLSGRYQIWDRRDQLALVNRSGDVSPLDCEPGGYALPSFTPDGTKATFTLFREKGADIWSFDLERGVKSLLTTGGNAHVTVWTPDGRYFLYSGDRLGEATQPDIFIEPADGGEAPRLLVQTASHLDPVACTPDGESLIYWDVLPDTNQDLFLMSLQEPGDSQPYLQTVANEAHLSFSPDGEYVAYTSDESGVNEVYIKPFRAAGGRIQVSAGSGREPLWHPSGRELFFLSSATNQMYSVAIDRSTGELTAGTPRLLWELPLRRHEAGVPNYALHPDGERFLVVIAEDAGMTKRHIHVALRWRDDLESRLAPRR